MYKKDSITASTNNILPKIHNIFVNVIYNLFILRSFFSAVILAHCDRAREREKKEKRKKKEEGAKRERDIFIRP